MIFIKTHFIYLLVPLLFINSAAAFEVSKANSMNGYKLSDYKDFEKNWKLVTVRYRKDTGEMRFTYANDLAFSILKNGKTDYPDGSVFAKIGFKTEEDPGFPSSAVPSGARRYQFMVRDKKKHATTDGWGYALFDRDGLVYPEPISTQTSACAACHHIIPERGYVFSQILDFTPGAVSTTANSYYKNKLTYITKAASTFPEAVSKYFPKETKTIHQLDHKISQFLFQGSLDEIKPALTKEAISSKTPTLIISADEKSFALAFVENFDLKCEQEGKQGYFVKSISISSIQKGHPNENRYCWVD